MFSGSIANKEDWGPREQHKANIDMYKDRKRANLQRLHYMLSPGRQHKYQGHQKRLLSNASHSLCKE